jgi:PatG C-terminal
MRASCSRAQPLDGFFRQALETCDSSDRKKEKNVMETELNEQSSSQLDAVNPAQAIAPPLNGNPEARLRPPVSPATCTSCGAAADANVNGMAAPSYVFAIGRVEMRFPTLGVEKEFAQASGRANTKGLPDRAATHAVLSEPVNRYLVRQVCWVLTIQGLDTYILVPRDPADYSQLLEAVRPLPSPLDLDVVVGVRGPIAPPEMCNGLMVPIVAFDQIYSFDREALIKSIPRPEKMTAKEFGPAAEELFDRIMLSTDNAGLNYEDRARNYLAVRYPAIYTTAAEAFARNSSLTALDVQPSPLSTTRKVVDVILSFTNRNTDVVDKFFTRVDVTEEFPFLVTKMSPYFDR